MYKLNEKIQVSSRCGYATRLKSEQMSLLLCTPTNTRINSTIDAAKPFLQPFYLRCTRQRRRRWMKVFRMNRKRNLFSQMSALPIFLTVSKLFVLWKWSEVRNTAEKLFEKWGRIYHNRNRRWFRWFGKKCWQTNEEVFYSRDTAK